MYSDKAQRNQDSRRSDLVKYNKNSRHRYSSTDITHNINKGKFSGDEKDNRSETSETHRRESSQSQNQVLSSLGNLRPKFLRPDDEELSFQSKGRKLEPSSSSSALVAQGSVHCGFRKPAENSDESLSSWNLSDGREGERRHSNRKPLKSRRSVDSECISGDVRQKSQDETLRDDTLKGEHLRDKKSSSAGYCDICFLN